MGTALPSYCPTRFGNYLVCANFVDKNFLNIKNFLIKISGNINDKAMVFTRNTELKKQLSEISKYFFLVEKIKFLETNGLSVAEQLSEYNS